MDDCFLPFAILLSGEFLLSKQLILLSIVKLKAGDVYFGGKCLIKLWDNI